MGVAAHLSLASACGVCVRVRVCVERLSVCCNVVPLETMHHGSCAASCSSSSDPSAPLAKSIATAVYQRVRGSEWRELELELAHSTRN